MALLFSAYSIGNLCSGCCDDCAQILGTPRAKCCKVSGQTRCYDPNDCLKCVGDGEVKELVDDCNTGDNLAEGKTSCCSGECYNNTCYKCEAKKVVENYDTSKQGCCSVGGKFDLETCFGCDSEDIIKYSCLSTQTCCEGKCIEPDDPCRSCSEPTSTKLSGVLTEKCKDNPVNKDCCGGTCWNATLDGCLTCDNGSLIQKTDCLCCSTTIIYNLTTATQSKCCKISQHELCCESGECADQCKGCS